MSNTNSLARTLLVTAFVAIGIAGAWGTMSGWLQGLVQQALQSGNVYEQLYTSADGEPVIVRMSRDARATEQVLSLDGQPKQVTTQDLLYPHYTYSRERSPYVMQRGDWSVRMASANDQGVPPVYWYVVHDGRRPARAYGVGFHSRTRQLVGYFGREGFSNVQPPRDQWFEVPSDNGLYGTTNSNWLGREPIYAGGEPFFLLLADGKLWHVDLAQKELHAVLDCPQALSVGEAWKIPAERPSAPPGVSPIAAQQFTPLIGLLRQPDSFLIVEPRTGKATTFPLPPSLRRQTLSASLLPDGNLLVFGTDWRNQAEYEVAWLNSGADAGKEPIKQQQVRLASWSSQPSWAVLGWQAAVVAPLPLAHVFFMTGAPVSMVSMHEADTYAAALASLLAETWLSTLVVLAIGVVCAAAAFRRQQRYGLPHVAAWAVFAFVFGIPGWLAYRYHRTWPVLEDCPSCGEPAPRNREGCLDCGAAFPPPPLKGIEVFA
jgi:hypothetical protein